MDYDVDDAAGPRAKETKINGREPTEMQALPVKIYNKRNREGKWGWLTLDLPLSS